MFAGLNKIADNTVMSEEDFQKALQQQQAHPWLLELMNQNKENIYDLPRKAVEIFTALSEHQIQECIEKGEQQGLKCNPPHYTPYYSTTEIKASQAFYAREHAEKLVDKLQDLVCTSCGEQSDQYNRLSTHSRTYYYCETCYEELLCRSCNLTYHSSQGEPIRTLNGYCKRCAQDHMCFQCDQIRPLYSSNINGTTYLLCSSCLRDYNLQLEAQEDNNYDYNDTSITLSSRRGFGYAFGYTTRRR